MGVNDLLLLLLVGAIAGLLADRLVGVLNGIDQKTWNPATDNQITAQYSAEALEGMSFGKDPLGVYQQLKVNLMHEIKTAPFYAVHITAGISHSNGGITTNGKGQVTDREKKVIPGLYAAGDTTIIWHSNYGGGFPAALVQGHIAGKNAAAWKPWK